MLNPPGSGRIGPPLCVNNSSPLGLDCHLITPNTPTTTESTLQTRPITNSEMVSPQSKSSDVPILIAVTIVVIIMFISATFLGVIVALMIYCDRRSRNSTTQNMYNTAVHTSTVTIDLAQNAAYGVTTETQGNRESSSIVIMRENDAYGVTMETQRNRESSRVVTSENAAYGVTTETQGNKEAPSLVTSKNAAYGVNMETQRNRESSRVVTSENAAYGVTTETQGNKEAPSLVTSENAAYGVTTETQGNREVRSLVTSENAAYGVTMETQEPVMSENAAYGAAPLSGQQ